MTANPFGPVTWPHTFGGDAARRRVQPHHLVARNGRWHLVAWDLGRDRCRLVLGAWSWAGLAAAVARFDTDVEVVGPAELKAAFAQLAQRFAAASSS